MIPNDPTVVVMAERKQHLAETGHEEGYDDDLGPFCLTCAIREAEGG